MQQVEVKRIQKTKKEKENKLIVWGPVFVLIVFAIITFLIIANIKKGTETQYDNKDTANAQANEQSNSHFYVTKVIDGDTIKVIGSDNIELDIRLAEIDAPEINQPYGENSANVLAEYISEKNIILKDVRKGKYGRFVANIYCNDIWVNLELVKNGSAWKYETTNSNEVILAEQYARKHKIGLWKAQKPIAPWEWRESNK